MKFLRINLFISVVLYLQFHETIMLVPDFKRFNMTKSYFINENFLNNKKANITDHLNQNNINNSSNNDTDLCSLKTDELLAFLLNSPGSNKTINDFKSFILYSGISFNDFGDYTNCVNDPISNYILASVSFAGTEIDFGLCYFKECNSNYIENSKAKLIALVNAKYNLNVTADVVKFSNPREIRDYFTDQKTTGLIISLSIMGLIACLSIIRLLSRVYGNIKNESKTNYRKLNENSNLDSNNINTAAGSALLDAPDCDYNENKKSFFAEFLKNFDLIDNARAIFKIENTNKTFEYLRVFDGVRFLSTCWVLWGHVFLICTTLGIKNFYDVLNKVEKFGYCILTSAFVSVDVFFYMSGFLLYFNLKKYLKPKTNKILFFCMALFQRWVRLLPFYLIGIFSVTYLLPYIIDGPKNYYIGVFTSPCEKYWWHNLLYIQNFFSDEYKKYGGISCVPVAWYLADDMIYFIVSTIILLIVYNKRIIKNLIFIFIFIGSCVYQIILCYKNDYTSAFRNSSQQKGDYFNDFYIQPLTRVTPYMLGILYCELFFETDVYRESQKETIKEEEQNEEKNYLRRINIYLKNSNNLCMFIFFISILQIIYGVFINWLPQNYDLGQGWQTFFITFNKIFFINGLGSLIHLTFLEKFSVIKNILTFSFFSVTSRITYGVYIIHFYILFLFFFNSDSSFKLDMINNSFYAMGLMSVSLILSFILGIFYESPVINLLKYLKNNERKGKKPAKIAP